MKNLKKILVTHNGSFHTDDVFACAALSLLLEREKVPFEIIRTRDEGVIAKADYVFDVGGVYDAEQNRFDHHQPGGAGKRENGIEYSSFGLVWRKFGEKLCGSSKVADVVDKKLVQPIDAADNGIDLIELKGEVKPYFIQDAFKAIRPGWKDITEENLFTRYMECVEIAKRILSVEMEQARGLLEARENVSRIYQAAEDKSVIVLDRHYPWEEEMVNYPESVFVVFPKINGTWQAESTPLRRFSFEKKKNFPAAWGGLRDEELQKISGVNDAIFCHRGLFMAVAKSKEGAIKLAQLALQTL